jgi:hypothetical protein
VFLRGDTGRGEAAGFSTSQWIGFTTFAVSFILHWILSGRAVINSSYTLGSPESSIGWLWEAIGCR